MFNKTINMLKKYSETIRYLIFGVLTVVVNTAIYMTFSMVINDLAANTLAFVLSVLFAYWTNSIFVFKNKMSWNTFGKFFGMRIGTILIDDGGLWLLLFWGCNNFIAKCIVNVIIIVLNYIFSKFFVFVNKEDGFKSRKEDET